MQRVLRKNKREWMRSNVMLLAILIFNFLHFLISICWVKYIYGMKCGSRYTCGYKEIGGSNRKKNAKKLLTTFISLKQSQMKEGNESMLCSSIVQFSFQSR